MDEHVQAPPTASPATGIAWKKFVLELPVALDPDQVKPYAPLRDEPFAYFAGLCLKFFAQRLTPELRRDLGRTMCAQATPENAHSFLEGWAAAGLGHLDMVQDAPDRFRFSSPDLHLEAEAARAPSCTVVLGFVEGLAHGASGGEALGTEVQCRSTGHPACVFVVRVRPQAAAAAQAVAGTA